MTDDTGIVRVDPERITRARELRAMTKTDLAQRVGVTIGVVITWEKSGIMRAGNFRAMCEALEMPESFFQLGRTTPAIARPNYRLLRSDTPQKWTLQAEAYAFMLADFLHVLDNSVGLPEVQVPDIPIAPDARIEEIVAAARFVREAFGFGLDPIGNATRRVEQAGVPVVFTPKYYSRGVDAYSTWSGTRPLMIHATADPARQRFDLFHELGHLVMHRAPLEPTNELDELRVHKARELQAHSFAAEMLMPSTEVVMALLSDAFVGRYWTKPLEEKPRWGASLQFMLRRALELGVIDQANYDWRWEDIRKRGWRTSEPGRIAFAEMPSLIARAYAELKEANPDADERLRRFHGISEEFLAQFTARAAGSRTENDGLGAAGGLLA